jgi:hypothetical protein
MPQVHNMLAVRSSSFNEWRDFLMGDDSREGLLDRGKMTDEETGFPMTPQRLELALRSVYDAIISDGWNDRRAGAFAGSGKVANRHADARFLIFKDADSWLTYAQKFGRPLSALSRKMDPGAAIYDAMIGHVHGMSRDIALMERLGPNPSATIRWLKDSVQKEAHLPKHPGKKRIDQASASSVRLDNLYKELTGGFEVEHPKLAQTMASIRSWESASKLGSAFLSSMGDVATQFVTRRFNGLPAMRVAADYVGGLKPTSAADRAHAARQHYIAESAIRTMGAYNRWTGEAMTGEIPARLSNAVMHLSLLDKWTDEGRRLFNKQVWAAITDNSMKSWDTLGKGTMDRRFRRMLQRTLDPARQCSRHGTCPPCFGDGAAGNRDGRAVLIAENPRGSRLHAQAGDYSRRARPFHASVPRLSAAIVLDARTSRARGRRLGRDEICRHAGHFIDCHGRAQLSARPYRRRAGRVEHEPQGKSLLPRDCDPQQHTRLHALVHQARVPARTHRPDAGDDRSEIPPKRCSNGAVGSPAWHALLVEALCHIARASARDQRAASAASALARFKSADDRA